MSQAHQDAFVLNVNGYKRNGTFVEIGSNHPIEHNNSYILESSYNWSGLLVEYDKSFGPMYDLHRPRSLYCLQDARTVPYREILDTRGFPNNIGYLQIDLDVNNKSTLDTLILLNDTVFDKYKFASVTFEHDIYTGDYFDTQRISRKIFSDRGYVLVFPDVSVMWEGSYKPFEDWYVHPDLVDMEYINKIRRYTATNCDDIFASLVPRDKIVLFLNHSKQQCGVYQYGLRLYNILKLTPNIKYKYIEINGYSDYLRVLDENPYADAIVYNYHNITMPWLNADNICKTIIAIGIPHESNHNFFNVLCNIDPTAEFNELIYPVPRPIFEDVETLLNDYTPSTNSIKEFIEYKVDDCITFGSFGFGFLCKGFDKIVQMVNEQYDKALIKFVIPKPEFGGETYDYQFNTVIERCAQLNLKPGIEFIISRDFFTNEDILYFLNSNNMNIFLYDELKGRSASSVIDYAISVNTPFGISDSYMFRHVYSDCICLYKNSINDCIKNYNRDIVNGAFNANQLREVFKRMISTFT
ncbi:MAG: hypothetical protein ACOVRN_03185 [Flavobacterium sp.]